MSNNAELQDEEREVLFSIYDGDEKFKQISSNVFQYKYGQDNEAKSFVLEIKWVDDYPEVKPEINMDAFYNRHIIQALKEKIVKLLLDEAEQYLGMSMTYSLFELLKEKFDELIEEQPEQLIETSMDNLTMNNNAEEEVSSKKLPKKEHLTKAQKRRQWDKVDSKGEKPRGWNWVDIVKHLSQLGPKDDAASATT